MKKMPKKVILLACMVLTIWGLSGCMRAPVVPPQGWLFSQTQAPLDTDMNSTKIGPKVGESSCITILGLVSVGDASIKEAAKNGGITTVDHADYKFTNVLGLFQQYTTIVYGE